MIGVCWAGVLWVVSVCVWFVCCGLFLVRIDWIIVVSDRGFGHRFYMLTVNSME